MTSIVSTRHHHPRPPVSAAGPGAGAPPPRPPPPRCRSPPTPYSSPAGEHPGAVCRVSDQLLRRVEERVADATYRPVTPPPTENVDRISDVPKHRKKSRRHDATKKRKRSTSCSTVSSCSSVSSKRHKKKKKKHGRNVDAPNPRVNPIFLWVRQDGTKIVEVLCEDYDKRNRITLTKTAAGWRAIPRTERLSRQSSYSRPAGSDGFADTKDSEDERALSCEPTDVHNDEDERDKDNVVSDNEEPMEDDRDGGGTVDDEEGPGTSEDQPASPVYDKENEKEDLPHSEVMDDDDEHCDKELEGLMEKVISSSPFHESHDSPFGHLDLEEGGPPEEPERSEVEPQEEHVSATSGQESTEFSHTESESAQDSATEKCCEMNNDSSNVDENHNNEYEEVNDGVTVEEACLLSKIKECSDSDTVDQLYREVDECVEKGLKDLIDELDEHCLHKEDLDDDKNCDNERVCLDEAIGCVDKSDFKCLESQNGYLGQSDCVDLMEELEEMCHGMITQRLKTEEDGKKEDIDDVYTFVPTPENICKADDSCYSDHDNKDVVSNEMSNITSTMIDEDDMCNPQYEETNSPINLVLEDKKITVKGNIKDEKTSKMYDPLDPSLDILWRLPEGTTIQHASKSFVKNNRGEEEVTPAHQHNTKIGKFADILNIPQPRLSNGVQDEPLDLGKAKLDKKPPPLLKEIKPVIPPDRKPPPKLEDINLKKILNNQQTKCNVDSEITMDAKTKSKLLELLTSDTLGDKLDPLAQLKEVLSDPNLTVPDPLLVPRARLPALVANPAKEIPRLLSQKQEKMSYPKLDPDLLVVSLAHLQSLLQTSGKDEELARLYQQQAQMLQSQLKQQEHGCLDPATANALNQMLWLPYLNQLEAAAAACGSNKEFLNMLNMVFPSSYPYVQSPYLQQMPQQSYDYNAALQNQMISAWQDAVQKPQPNGNALKTEPSKKYDPYKMYLKPEKKSASRTSPVPNKYQQYKHRNNNYMLGNMNTAYNYTDRGGNPGRHSGGQNQYSSHQRQATTMAPSAASYRTNDPTSQYGKQSRTSMQNYYQQQQQNAYLQHHHTQQRASGEQPKSSGRRHNQSQAIKECGYLQGHGDVKPASFGEYCLKANKPDVDPIGARPPTDHKRPVGNEVKPSVPKLKVKEHLVDPNARPKLLKFDDDHHHLLTGGGGPPNPQSHSAAAVAAAAAAAAAAAQHLQDPAHTHLWHPLFSSHQGNSYSSPWQWTTPVTVSGE